MNLKELKINRNEIYHFYKLIFDYKYFVGFVRTNGRNITIY